MSRRPSLSVYAGGLGCCTLVALGTLFGMTHWTPGGGTPEALTHLGYTFSGLTLLVAVLSFRNWRQPAAHPRAWVWHVGAYLLPALFGAAFWMLGGTHPQSARHARVFALLPPIMFIALVPRPQRVR